MKHYKEIARTFYDRKNVIMPHSYSQPNTLLDLTSLNAQFAEYELQERRATQAPKIQVFSRFPIYPYLLTKQKKSAQKPSVSEQQRFWKKPRGKQTAFNSAIKDYMDQRKKKFSMDKRTLENEIKRCIRADPKNIFLRKLLKAKKVPFYDRAKLRSQIPDRIRKLSEKGITSAGIKRMLKADGYKTTINKLRNALNQNRQEQKRERSPSQEDEEETPRQVEPQSEEMAEFTTQLRQQLKTRPSGKWEHLFDHARYMSSYQKMQPDMSVTLKGCTKINSFVRGLQDQTRKAKQAILG